MSAHAINRDIRDFEAAVSRLSSGVSKASALWRDEKFMQLSSSVREVAMQSKEVITSGERLCTDLERFESIASESY